MFVFGDSVTLAIAFLPCAERPNDYDHQALRIHVAGKNAGANQATKGGKMGYPVTPAIGTRVVGRDIDRLKPESADKSLLERWRGCDVPDSEAIKTNWRL